MKNGIVGIVCAMVAQILPVGLLAGEDIAQAYADSLMRIELIKPAYRASLFSTQPDKEIVVRLARKAESTGAEPCEVRILDAQGEVVRSGTIATEGGVLRLDGGDLKPGVYAVECRGNATAEGKVVQTIRLTVLAPSPVEVYFDEEGILYRNGKPVFIRGLYAIDEGRLKILNEEARKAGEEAIDYGHAFDTMASLGFNTVVLWTWLKPDVLVDLAAKRNLMSIRCAHDAPGKWEQSVEELRSRPELIAWATWDEPHTADAFEKCGAMYQKVRELDPYRPNCLTQCYSDHYGTTARFCDILACDTYPLGIDPWWEKMTWWDATWKSPLRLGMKYLEMSREASKGKVCWYVVQCHGGETFCTLPTPKELRSLTYQAVVAGVRGLLFYAYHCPDTVKDGRHFWLEKCPETMAMLKRVNGELAQLEPVLLAHGGETSTPKEAPDVRVLQRDCQSKRYVFAVNVGEDEAEFSARLPFAGGHLTTLMGSEPATINGTEMHMRLEAQGVGLYEVAK